ncbi:zinc ribbon domain-containing protein, partial [Intestinibacter bartlettii]|uniref:zinc ribbon domain-containing protein n=1 Tax=Intestinibacter bartlettii TaxID=261299 RepID=UPI0039947123
TIIWIVLDNNKKNKQRDKVIESLRQQQLQQYNQNINSQESTEQQINKNANHEINQEINSCPTEDLIQESTNQENLSYTELDNKIDDTDENNIEEICPNCKNPIKKGIKFCGNCGQKLL